MSDPTCNLCGHRASRHHWQHLAAPQCLDCPETTCTARNWREPASTQPTAVERREAAVAEMVADVLRVPPGTRYATAYGALSALVTSSDVEPLSWARSFVRQLEEAMSSGLSHQRTIAAVQARMDEWTETGGRCNTCSGANGLHYPECSA